MKRGWGQIGGRVLELLFTFFDSLNKYSTNFTLNYVLFVYDGVFCELFPDSVEY